MRNLITVFDHPKLGAPVAGW